MPPPRASLRTDPTRRDPSPLPSGRRPAGPRSLVAVPTPRPAARSLGHDSRAAHATWKVLQVSVRRGHVLGLVDVRGGDVVLTSHGPLALHPVWLDLRDGEHPEPHELLALADDARCTAGRSDAELSGVGVRLASMPVVVVWGPTQDEVPSGGRIKHDVMFLRGRELKGWLKRHLAGGEVWSALEVTAVQARIAQRRRQAPGSVSSHTPG